LKEAAMLKFNNILTDEEIVKIHEASLDIATNVGLRIDHDKALQKLADAGAKVDFKNSQVRFTLDLIEKALALAPSKFLCAGRNEAFDIDMRYDRPLPYIRAGAGSINYFDALSNEMRPMTRQDCIDYTLLGNALSHIDLLCTATPQDLPANTYDVYILKDMLTYSKKHIWALVISSRNLKYELEMMVTAAGSRNELAKRPLCNGIVCIIDPFFIPHDEVERLMLYNDYHIPVRVPLVPMMGATAPYTVAGALTQANAEFISTLTMVQTLCPQLPLWYYVIPRTMDMRTGFTISASTPETVLFSIAAGQLARHYRVPADLSSGSATGAQIHQIIFHYGSTLQATMASGATGIGGVGNLDGGNMYCPELLIIADELLGYFKHIQQGITINAATMAVDAMKRVGPQGNFLADTHTIANLRNSHRFTPKLLEWSAYDQWCATDCQTILDRAREQTVAILKKEKRPVVDKDVLSELDKIAMSADREANG
jgi:trimethylamine--corrinoid protein Co-methyltransferase